MNRTYRLIISLMAAWLVASIILSWPSILDDALIHLRYADNFLHTGRITYDGVHPEYGVSSLLYVMFLASLRSFIASPNLPRGVSSAFHLLLFAGLTIVIGSSIARQASRLRLLGFLFLFILVVPSSIRWLDDGMETSLVLCFTALICWITFQESHRPVITPLRYVSLVLVGFLIVLLRTELSVLCAVSFAILIVKKVVVDSQAKNLAAWGKTALQSSHLLVGNILALAAIFLTMHVLLPDTAVAKSHGLENWRGVFTSTAHAIAGGFSFGAGMVLLWLITLFLLIRVRQLTPPVLLANSIFPVVFVLAFFRGQEIQGIRYLIWTFFFSVLWNLMELGMDIPVSAQIKHFPDRQFPGQSRAATILGYGLLALILIGLPFEAREVYPVIFNHARLMNILPTQHLDVLQGKLGVAADVGIIGYFSKANICDLSGLIDGRKFARMTPDERIASCAAQKPDFLFLSRGQYATFEAAFTPTDWQVCGAYEMAGLHFKDVHYLILPPSTAPQICRQTSGAQPYPISRILALPSE